MFMQYFHNRCAFCNADSDTQPYHDRASICWCGSKVQLVTYLARISSFWMGIQSLSNYGTFVVLTSHRRYAEAIKGRTARRAPQSSPDCARRQKAPIMGPARLGDGCPEGLTPPGLGRGARTRGPIGYSIWPIYRSTGIRLARERVYRSEDGSWPGQWRTNWGSKVKGQRSGVLNLSAHFPNIRIGRFAVDSDLVYMSLVTRLPNLRLPPTEQLLGRGAY